MGDLSVPAIVDALDGTRFRDVEVHPELDSTQTLLVTEGGPDGRVVVADHQRAGRGRMGRIWVAPPGTSLLFSALLRDVPLERAPLVGLGAGVAVARAIEDVCGAQARLKWPNDVLLDGCKVCGVLGELAQDAVVLGVGVNVRQRTFPPELEATSLGLATGADVDRGELLVAILRNLDGLVRANDWLDDYRARCATLGSRVRVELSDGTVEGEATEVTDDGALVVDGRRIVTGDVVHVRTKEAGT